MSEASTDSLETVPNLQPPGPIYITAKAVAVENRGTQDVVIQTPGSFEHVTVKVNEKKDFQVEGEYIGRYPNTNYDAFSFKFKDGNVTFTSGIGTALGASIVIYIIVT